MKWVVICGILSTVIVVYSVWGRPPDLSPANVVARAELVEMGMPANPSPDWRRGADWGLDICLEMIGQ